MQRFSYTKNSPDYRFQTINCWCPLVTFVCLSISLSVPLTLPTHPLTHNQMFTSITIPGLAVQAADPRMITILRS